MLYRIDVFSAETDVPDPQGERVRQEADEFGVTTGRVDVARLYFVDVDADADRVRRDALPLLCDPVTQRAGLTGPGDSLHDPGRGRLVEVHPKPGVTDPVAQTAAAVLRDAGMDVRQVRTGRAYRFGESLDDRTLDVLVRRVLANAVVEEVDFTPRPPTPFAEPPDRPFELRRVPIRSLSDDELNVLSRQGHLFLSLDEMKAIQAHCRTLGREPTDVELETIAQTWSEHCVHKTLKSRVEVVDPGGNRLRTYGNLIKETIFAATETLMRRRDDGFCLSVFKDNAGVVAFDETDAVCFKVETHNHPSAIEPYGGSATGVGGVIRDVLGTGLGARPVANTDVFCVAYPDTPAAALPGGVIHPKRTLRQIVAGVRDYGNRMGIPTVNGAVYFDERYVGNPLVFCGCAGIIPRDRIDKAARPDDVIVVLGGRTGRDGIHGATFSSAELTDAHADEFGHAVQIGDAITEKKVLDVLLQARDAGLLSAVTDCGAGGLSSAVGEMGETTGAEVHLDRVTLKYAGLRYDEIWISEAQERMVLAVGPDHLDALLALAAAEDVEATAIGRFGTPDRELTLFYRGTEVARLSMDFLHDGLPMPTRTAVVSDGRTNGQPTRGTRTSAPLDLLDALRHPNVASKHWIIRQYDHEVQGGSVVKPLVGPLQLGPSDAAVVRPKLGSDRGVVLSCGLAPHVADPYAMAIASIDEAVRNAVCVGASLETLALLDNFCWPSCDDAETMGALVRTCEACRDYALVAGLPFISGKDSLHNQFTDSANGRVIRIPNTLLISAIGVIGDVKRCVTSYLKRPGSTVLAVSATDPTDLAGLSRLHRAVASSVASGRVSAAHDVSDGGPLVAAAEMAIGGGRGLRLTVDLPVDVWHATPGGYLLEIDVSASADVTRELATAATVRAVGHTTAEPTLRLHDGRSLPVADLTAAWRGTLDW